MMGARGYCQIQSNLDDATIHSLIIASQGKVKVLEESLRNIIGKVSRSKVDKFLRISGYTDWMKSLRDSTNEMLQRKRDKNKIPKPTGDEWESMPVHSGLYEYMWNTETDECWCPFKQVIMQPKRMVVKTESGTYEYDVYTIRRNKHDTRKYTAGRIHLMCEDAKRTGVFNWLENSTVMARQPDINDLSKSHWSVNPRSKSDIAKASAKISINRRKPKPSNTPRTTYPDLFSFAE
ncbi:hypothetical protein PLEI_1467 [Photobacterium leiognathi lrivu.4.1]|uniref:Uncharacterized protein n=1 Tax=Photobacterium leiognathi lrivu.4.1 TaxID=1248232 RepID=A0A0U1P636_PHOLE|nr:hypothetical protein [Photobacterium leiognathi]GAD29814.1 hypothetical protein PLEI_1467 [Photobacterium leiognathi lrivu.4.1]